MASAILRAVEKRDEFLELSRKVKEWGIFDRKDRSVEEATSAYTMARRALQNPALGQAFTRAAQSTILIILTKKFTIGTSAVFINEDATDDEIIAFLLGT